MLIAGHARLRAARKLGLETVPVVIAESLTPDQARAYRIADNRTHDYTTWDYSQLAAELDGLDDDFARVLDLADWQGIVREFESGPEGGAEDSGGSGRPDDVELDDDLRALITGRHTATVYFESQEAAALAAPEIVRLPGVLHMTDYRRDYGQPA